MWTAHYCCFLTSQKYERNTLENIAKYFKNTKQQQQQQQKTKKVIYNKEYNIKVAVYHFQQKFTNRFTSMPYAKTYNKTSHNIIAQWVGLYNLGKKVTKTSKDSCVTQDMCNMFTTRPKFDGNRHKRRNWAIRVSF